MHLKCVFEVCITLRLICCKCKKTILNLWVEVFPTVGLVCSNKSSSMNLSAVCGWSGSEGRAWTLSLLIAADRLTARLLSTLSYICSYPERTCPQLASPGWRRPIRHVETPMKDKTHRTVKAMSLLIAVERVSIHEKQLEVAGVQFYRGR